jgi:hypothetical protein
LLSAHVALKKYKHTANKDELRGLNEKYEFAARE